MEVNNSEPSNRTSISKVHPKAVKNSSATSSPRNSQQHSTKPSDGSSRPHSRNHSGVGEVADANFPTTDKVYRFDPKTGTWQDRPKNKLDNDIVFHLDTKDGRFKLLNEQEMLTQWQQRYIGEDIEKYVQNIDEWTVPRKSKKISTTEPSGKHI